MAKVVRLHVIGGGSMELRDDVPETRAGCPTGPCGAIRCRYHLWRVDGDHRPGRRPRDDDAPRTLVRPGWMEWPQPETCALRVADASRDGEWTEEQVADAAGMSQSRLRDVVRIAREKLASALEVRELADA